MHKISFSGSSKGLLLNFVIKTILFSILSVVTFALLFSSVALKLDLDEKYFKYISIAVVSFSSIIISYFSVKSFKNNGFVMGVIAVFPLIVYSFSNLLLCQNSAVFFIIKLVSILILGGAFGYYSTKKRKKIRVK